VDESELKMGELIGIDTEPEANLSRKQIASSWAFEWELCCGS
jgi:hypothetical protein